MTKCSLLLLSKSRLRDISVIKTLLTRVEGNPVTLCANNITSMMGGNANIWESGKDREVGLVDALGKPLDPKTIKFNDNQSANDGILELSVMATSIHMAIGRANRVAQEKGPLTIVFKELPKNKKLETYF